MTEKVSLEYYLDENGEETNCVKSKTVIDGARKTVINYLPNGNESEKKVYVKKALRKLSIYYETGKLQKHEEYNKEGKLHGDCAECYLDGRYHFRRVYVNGIVTSYAEYNEDGTLVIKKTYDSTTGVEINGEKTKHYENGNIKTYMNYVDGVLLRWTDYYDNGDLMIDRTYYHTGGNHGEWIFYNKDRSIFTIHRYYNDLLHHELLPSSIRYFDNGKPHTVEYRYMGKLHCNFGPAKMVFTCEGYKKEYVSYYKHGMYHNEMGPAWTRYRDDKPWFTEHYVEGKLVKKETYF